MIVEFFDVETIDYASFPLPTLPDGREHEVGEDLTACYALSIDDLI